MEQAESGTQAPRGSAPMARPLVLPEPYSGEKDFTEWVDHFEDVAAINGWNENTKLAWLKVRLTDWAQTAFKRLPQSAREGLTDAVKPLKERLSLVISPHCSRKTEKKVLKTIGDSVHEPKSGWRAHQYLIQPEGNPVE